MVLYVREISRLRGHTRGCGNRSHCVPHPLRAQRKTTCPREIQQGKLANGLTTNTTQLRVTDPDPQDTI